MTTTATTDSPTAPRALSRVDVGMSALLVDLRTLDALLGDRVVAVASDRPAA